MTTNSEVLTLGIEGMTCNSCQRRVQNALRAVPGVLDAAVDLASGTATIRYEPSRTRAVELYKAVRAAGYEAGAPQAGAPSRSRRRCCS